MKIETTASTSHNLPSERWSMLVLPYDRTSGKLEAPWLSSRLVEELNRVIQLDRSNDDLRSGNILLFYPPSDEKFERVMLVPLEKKSGKAHEAQELHRPFEEALMQMASHPLASLLFSLESLPWEQASTLIQRMVSVTGALIDTSDSFRTKEKLEPFKLKLEQLHFVVAESHLPVAQGAVTRAKHYATAQTRCRRIANLPGNLCTPKKLVEEALALAAEYPEKLKVVFHDKEKLRTMGMGGLFAVGQGSSHAPYLIEIHYQGNHPGQDEAPIALVGKGVTFDSGGISIKPSKDMHHMKFDMCGAASLFGVIEGACLLGLKDSLIAVIPACENLPGGESYRPGDILTMYSGLTVEVLNTDAEGRLALADALAYAESQYKPKAIIDLATLTGACVVALGDHRSGLYSNDEEMKAALMKAGESEADLAWPMPLDAAYDAYIRSPTADLANSGVAGRGAGSITAARFLSKFVKNTPWAHLDIAGTAYKASGRTCATGRPVALLLSYLEHHRGS